ncbi:hypothetical protein GXW82_25000 [Streptacidiphilus sp. 4-A2]|nr:hypothetical protein [Streptacidiphilus sp. 4-A2]
MALEVYNNGLLLDVRSPGRWRRTCCAGPACESDGRATVLAWGICHRTGCRPRCGSASGTGSRRRPKRSAPPGSWFALTGAATTTSWCAPDGRSERLRSARVVAMTTTVLLPRPVRPPARSARSPPDVREAPGARKRRASRGAGPVRGRLLPRVLVGLGLALLPWLVVLATTLPTTATACHWSLAWVGLDCLEALGLIGTGVLLRRGDPRRSLTAVATAVLLVCDAWFDTTTSTPGRRLRSALAMALLVELPLAGLCLRLALRALPRG